MTTSPWSASFAGGIFATLALSFGPDSAFAFDSNVPGLRIHEAITTAAARAVGIQVPMKSCELTVAVGRPDYLETTADTHYLLHHGSVLRPVIHPEGSSQRAYDPTHHFDRPPGASDADDFTAARSYLLARVNDAVTLAKSGRDEDAVIATGEALHATQDFFAHSNFVDLSESERSTALNALFGEGDLPTSMRFTGYSATAADPGSPPNDNYAHDANCKDSPGANDVAKNPPERDRVDRYSLQHDHDAVMHRLMRETDPATKDQLRRQMEEITAKMQVADYASKGSPTSFQLARTAAVSASSQLLRRIQGHLSALQWGALTTQMIQYRTIPQKSGTTARDGAR